MSLRTEDRVIEVVHADTDVGRSLLEQAFAPVRSDEVVVGGRRYRVHANGGGLVSVTAFVGARVFVAESARVEENAIVLDMVRLLDRAVVSGNAVVADRCELQDDSRVGGFATLIGKVTLRRHAKVDGVACLEGSVLLDCHAHITRGHLYGPLFIE